VSADAYLVITMNDGTLLESEYSIDFSKDRYMENPFPGRPKLSSGKNPLFEIESYGLGLSTDVTLDTQTGLRAGKPHFKDLAVTRKLDVATTTLFSYLVAGEPVKYADVLLTKASGTNTLGAVYCAFGLGTVLFSSLQWSDDDEAPVESVSLSGRKYWTAYRRQKPSGNFDDWTVRGWDRIKNAPA
jgi:type VI protein secretion system component Hcp